MKPIPIAAAAALALTLAAGTGARAAEACSHETLSIRATPVNVAYCVLRAGRAKPGESVPLALNETYASPRGSLNRTVTVQFIAGENPSRAIEDVPLEPLGLTGTLHVTLAYAGGLVRIESAILTPGAITIK